jgi:hypothetical protein
MTQLKQKTTNQKATISVKEKEFITQEIQHVIPTVE